MKDKDVIEDWLKLYNVLKKSTFRVIEWPDQQNRTQKAIDALCEDDSGKRLAIEHTLIQPFIGEMEDRARFCQTLAALENDPKLVLPGFAISVSQSVDCVPSSVHQRLSLKVQLRSDLARILPTLPEGRSKVEISCGKNSIPLTIFKDRVAPDKQSSFTTARIWPGDPGPELVLTALKAKVPKLARYTDATKILLLEKNAVAGTIESQFEQLPATVEVEAFLQQIDEIWVVNTVCVESESVIFANNVWPTLSKNDCSLNLKTNDFRQAPCWYAA